MKSPKSLKECRTDDEIEKYILANDGLSDEDLESLEPVELGAGDHPENIIPVSFEPEELVAIQKIARRQGKLSSTLIREWAIQRSRHELGPKGRPRGQATNVKCHRISLPRGSQ